MSLFHYTSVQAIQSILTSQKIWLTDIRFLNDKTEIQQGINLLDGSLERLKSNNNNNNNIKVIELIENLMIDNLDESPLFVFSFSKAQDRLSQWRSYGFYGIEFDEDMLQEHNIVLHPCFYGEQDKDVNAAKFLLNSIEKITKEMDKNGSITELCIDEIINLKKLAATFKDNAFFEEEEMRIIITDENKIKYRTKNDKLIPYVELACPLDCIKAIHVGPMSDQHLAYMSMLSFVKQVEKDWQNNYGNIEFEINVLKSTIPYRG